MAGVVSGICQLAVGAGVGVTRQRPTEAQSRPNASTNTNTNTTTTPRQSEEDKWIPKPTSQNIKGLTNQTGFVKGNANGVINLGTFETQSRP